MPKLLLFIGLLLMFGCHDPEKDYRLPKTKDINEIVQIILKGKSYRDTLPLCIYLSRTGDTLKGLPGIDLEKLVNQKASYHIQKVDSAYFIFQIHNLHHLKIDTIGILNAKFTSATLILKKTRKERFAFFYNEMSIPLFSLDGNHAYVTVESYFGVTEDDEYAFILRKTNGKWKIVREELIGQS